MDYNTLTDNFFIEQRKRITHNKMTYIKQTLTILQEHLNGDYILHPKEIKHLISNCLESMLTLNEYSMDKYDKLSNKEKEQVNNRYESSGKWSTSDQGTRTASDEIKEAVWNSIEEHYKQYVGEAYNFIDRR